MRRCWSNDRGTSAVEFAIIAPAATMLLVGGLSLCLMLFAIGSMHYAVEDAARCFVQALRDPRMRSMLFIPPLIQLMRWPLT